MRKLSSILASILLTFAIQPVFAKTHTILVLGDSLSAAYGMSTDKGWVNLTALALKTGYPCYQIVNASQSGMTSKEGLMRLPQLLSTYKPSLTLLELGANDGLRGLPLTHLQQNLNQMITNIKSSGSKAILIGIYLPLNYGKDYTDKFQSVFAKVAHAQNITFIPFLLKDVEGQDHLFQKDNLHPNETAQPLIKKSVLPTIKTHLKVCPK